MTRLSHADTLPAIEAAEENAAKLRFGEVTTYLRQQSLRGMSLLPGGARDVVGWFSGSWHAMEMSGSENAADASSAPEKLTDDNDSSVGLASNFHHKGFLPTHDTMMMGAAFKTNAVNNKLQFTARPFVGQSWLSLRDYWGGEIGMNVAQHPDGLPWGQISLGYVGGAETLTDHGRGLDLHGDIDLTSGWKFTSGVRQNSWDGNSDYVMLKWGLSFE